MAQSSIDDQIQSPLLQDQSKSTTFKFRKFQTYSSSGKSGSIKNRRGWISHKWGETKNVTFSALDDNSCDTRKGEVGGNIPTLIQPIECDSDHSNLGLTDDDEDDDDEDDDMNGKPNQSSETNDDSEDDEGCDDGLLDDYIQIDEKYECPKRPRQCRYCSHDDTYPFAEGKFRYVYHSHYCVESQQDGKKLVNELL